jgi:hypothetical protein
MTHPETYDRSRTDTITLDDTPALSQDVPFDISAIHEAWPKFENSFDSLRGRKMMGLFTFDEDVYRMATARLDRDHDNPLGYDETVIPGGHYLRLRLRGPAPAIYERIAPAFDELFASADYDPTRPHIEYYRREGAVDCLVPINTPT